MRVALRFLHVGCLDNHRCRWQPSNAITKVHTTLQRQSQADHGGDCRAHSCVSRSSCLATPIVPSHSWRDIIDVLPSHWPPRSTPRPSLCKWDMALSPLVATAILQWQLQSRAPPKETVVRVTLVDLRCQLAMKLSYRLSSKLSA